MTVFKESDLKTDQGIAEVLAPVEIDDPNLDKPDVKTDQDFFEKASLTVAKAEAVKEVTESPSIKKRLERFIEKTKKDIADFFAGVRMKAVSAAALVVTVATACSAKISPTISPEPGGTGTTSTLVTPSPDLSTSTQEVQTATQNPTNTPEATATPDIFETANPFVESSWPADIRTIAENPAAASEADQNKFQDFLDKLTFNFAEREGVQSYVDNLKASKTVNQQLLSLWVRMFMFNNPDKLKDPSLVQGKDMWVAPPELRAALTQIESGIKELKGWNDNGVAYGFNGQGSVDFKYDKVSVFGVDVENDYFAITDIWGALGGVARFDGDPTHLILLIDIKDYFFGNWYVFPRFVSLDPNFVLSSANGATCRVGGGYIDSSLQNVPFGPVVEPDSDTPVTKDELESAIGLQVYVDERGTYRFEQYIFTGSIPADSGNCFMDGIPIAPHFATRGNARPKMPWEP
jgi:hypothetical protein